MIDRVEIFISSGNGGNGAISGRREKFVPEGGPDGGDGGTGGSVTVWADPNENTLLGYQYKKKFSANDGGNGSGKLRHGKNGSDIRLRVPVGTQVWIVEGKQQRMAYDLNMPGENIVLARGGEGGKGNARFKSSTNRFPLLAEGGAKGEQLAVRFEMKLLSDVGIVGSPNAGKSSLLAAVTAARPKIAEYPFTTTEPILGVVRHQETNFVFADIPGLLEGAHDGVGLGLEFLRHVERTKLLVHVVDGSLDRPIEEYKKIRKEMGRYSTRLLSKPEIVAINKMDILGTAPGFEEAEAKMVSEGIRVRRISAVTGEGIVSLMDDVVQALEDIRTLNPSVEQQTATELPVIHAEDPFPLVKKGKGEYVVSDPRTERVAVMVDPNNWNARLQFYEHMRRHGVIAALERAGISPGEVFRVGHLEWEWN